MESSKLRTTWISWSISVRALSTLAALWSGIQAAYLAINLWKDAPSPTAQLMFEHHETEFFYSLIFHAVAFLVFGLAAIFAGKIGNRIDNMEIGGAKIRFQILVALAFALPATALLVVFSSSKDHPRYEVFLDNTRQEIVRRDTSLLPPGVSEDSVSFSDIRSIQGKMFFSGWWGDRYFLRVVTQDWRRINIAQGARGEKPEALFPLAQDFANQSGADLDLSSKQPLGR